MTGDQYKDAMGALARSAEMPPERAAGIERELLQAFVEHHAAPVPDGRRWARARWRPWLAAAAALVVIAGGFEAWRSNTGVTLNNVTTEAGPPVPVGGSPPPAGSDFRTPSTSGEPSAPASLVPISSGRASAVPGRRAVSQVVRPSGFVALPGTAGLPQFESGTIVRIELPVASLPAYGVDISPAAGDQPVEADVLVGQDGQPRAIRLVTNSSRSGQ
jgi:hypothetical protein